MRQPAKPARLAYHDDPLRPRRGAAAPAMSLQSLVQRLSSTLRARYDAAALRPPTPGSVDELRPAHDAVRMAMLQACHEAASPDAPAWGLLVLASPDHSALQAVARTLSLQLDGSQQLLARRGAAARLWLRLRVKLQDARGGPARRSVAIWDCGHAAAAPVALHALVRLTPRRPTLVVLDAPAAPLLLEAVRVLVSRSAQWAHPVRLLVLTPVDATLQAWPGAAAALKWELDPA